VQYVDEGGTFLPGYDVAVDGVGAGLDEWVLVSHGSAARQTPGGEKRPIDALIVGIIDTVSLDNQWLYSKRDQDR
jgi:carbon dioxide concentrating mechanism protein CcmL